MRVVALDTETTGLNRRRNGCSVSDGHRIIEIGCVEIIDELITGRSFHVYLKPDRKIDKKAIDVHGITDAFLDDKPAFVDIVVAFLDFIRGSTLVIHNAAFDTAFLDKEFGLLEEKLQPVGIFNVIDTLKISREMFPRENNTLRFLAKRFDVEAEDKHGALTDAVILAGVYLALIKL